MTALLFAVTAASVAANLVAAVPRESPDFDPELHVPDISESESVPHDERRESEVGCHWTARLKLQLCSGAGDCHDAEILAFDFQRRAWSYYEESNQTHGGVSRAPPVDEAFWIAAIPREEILGSFELCPGLVVTALFIVAEVHFAVWGLHAGVLQTLDLAKSFMSVLYVNRPLEYGAMESMWPVAIARTRADGARASAVVHAGRPPPSVDVVIARCSTSLHWLWELSLPPQVRILVYEKCPRPDGELERQLEGVVGKVSAIVRVPTGDAGPWMTGECGAYLRHVFDALEPGTDRLADFTIFLHDDAPRHLKPAFLGVVFRALAIGSYNAPFLNLAHERYVEIATPCLQDLYRIVFGRELKGRLSTYCCGHFVVSAARVRATPWGQYERLWHSVSQGVYTARAGGKCEVANMPCYVVEHIWHVLFGEDDLAPWRSEDVRLPLHLRYEGGRETLLPSPLKFSPYMHQALR